MISLKPPGKPRRVMLSELEYLRTAPGLRTITGPQQPRGEVTYHAVAVSSDDVPTHHLAWEITPTTLTLWRMS